MPNWDIDDLPERYREQVIALEEKRKHLFNNEYEFELAVIEHAKLHGWEVYSIPDSRRATSSGYPDLTLAHAASGTLLFRELKHGANTTSERQNVWLDSLKACGADAAVWHSEDWLDIAKQLIKK